MNIIQTLWSRNSPNYLSENCGWLSSEYNLMSWALSCLQLKEFYNHVTLYADSVSAKLMIDTLRLPYTEVVCNLDKLNTYHPKLWALPKVHTYSVQEEPFLHIDGDVFIWKAFEEELLQSQLIAQNKESATSYYESIMKLLEAGLKYFPPEIEEERKNKELIYAYNAGVFGGTDIPFFKEYCKKAFEFVDANLSNLGRINVVDFNIFFEQYLFYCLVKKERREVAVLFSDLIDDTQYTGFGDFHEVPHNKTFLHLLGNYKKSTLVCNQMAYRLREDFPEYYYRIIELYKKAKLPLFKDYYYFTPSINEAKLLSRYNNLKENYCAKQLSMFTAESIRPNFEQSIDKFIIPNEEPTLQEDYEKFRQSLSTIIVKKFCHLSKDYLYARDISCTRYFAYIFGDMKKIFEKMIVKDTTIEIIQSKHRWAITNQILLKEDIDNSAEIYTVAIPECDKVGYNLIYIDELDVLMYEVLEKPLSITQLFEKIKFAFDSNDLNESLQEFEKLILGRIKNGLLSKTLKCVIEE